MEQVSIKQREILLVPFPFSDQSGKKARPVVVISNDRFNHSSQDIIVCSITTNTIKDFYTIPITKNSLEEKKIVEECCIKVENLLKIDKKLIIKKLDKLNEEEFKNVKKLLIELF